MANDGSESIFNEAALKMRRIDDSQQLINSLSINLLKFNPPADKYNYEIVCSEFMNLANEVYGKLSDTNKKIHDKWIKTLINVLETLPVYENFTTYSFYGVQTKKRVNENNWKIVREYILGFGNQVREWLEDHGFSSPNKQEDPEFEF